MNCEINHISARLEQLEQRCERAEARYFRAERRFRLLGGLALATIVTAILISPASRHAIAQANNSIAARVAALEAKTRFLAVDDNGNTVFEHTNLVVRNGTPPIVDEN